VVKTHRPSFGLLGLLQSELVLVGSILIHIGNPQDRVLQRRQGVRRHAAVNAGVDSLLRRCN
jgi:hypothetical protein